MRGVQNSLRETAAITIGLPWTLVVTSPRMTYKSYLARNYYFVLFVSRISRSPRQRSDPDGKFRVVPNDSRLSLVARARLLLLTTTMLPGPSHPSTSTPFHPPQMVSLSLEGIRT